MHWAGGKLICVLRYFPASEQQRYEHEYGSICQLDQENSGEYMERFTRLASFVGAAGDAQRQARHFKWGLKKWFLDRIVNTDYTNVAQVAAAVRNIELLHESGIEMVIGFRTGDMVNRRSGVVMTRVSMCIGVVRTRVLSIGVVRIEVMIRNDMIFGVRSEGYASGSSSQRRSTETLPPPPLCTTCGKSHPGVCYKATGDVLLVGLLNI
nr:zinc finger, CCHC-type, retrotransposon Gag domain protein [Tanacetum cinerariifolium]